MLIIKLVAAGIIVIATVLVLMRIHREITGSDSVAPRPKEKTLTSNDLESLIAAYRRDKDGAAAVPAPTVTSWTARKSFLTAHTKLCYLVVKTALPDHHVFCNTRLGDALELHSEHPLAGVKIDLIVCNKELGPIAAIDVCNTEDRSSPPEREKSARLQSAGIRYLRFTPGGIPKPNEVRDLIYRA
jgi:hypothetical protein